MMSSISPSTITTKQESGGTPSHLEQSISSEQNDNESDVQTPVHVTPHGHESIDSPYAVLGNNLGLSSMSLSDHRQANLNQAEYGSADLLQLSSSSPGPYHAELMQQQDEGQGEYGNSDLMDQPVKKVETYDIYGQYQIAQAAEMAGLDLSYTTGDVGEQGSGDHYSGVMQSQTQQEMYFDPSKLQMQSPAHNANNLYGHPGLFGHYLPQDTSMGYSISGNGANNAPADDGRYFQGFTPQKAVTFLAGPRERIHVFGNPLEFCPRCQQEGFGNVSWRPHRHIGELKIRYICERNFDDLESNHHFDIPLCPLCGQVLYLYEFNAMLGVSSARRLHKYVLKCANRHVLPLIDLFCQTKRGGQACNSNYKLQWTYGTMVKRCEAQKNRDHDLWWVRYKHEWKQRRTIIRYKKDFLRHLSDVQRQLLLGLGIEGEAPPDPKTAIFAYR